MVEKGLWMRYFGKFLKKNTTKVFCFFIASLLRINSSIVNAFFIFYLHSYTFYFTFVIQIFDKVILNQFLLNKIVMWNTQEKN